MSMSKTGGMPTLGWFMLLGIAVLCLLIGISALPMSCITMPGSLPNTCSSTFSAAPAYVV